MKNTILNIFDNIVAIALVLGAAFGFALITLTIFVPSWVLSIIPAKVVAILTALGGFSLATVLLALKN